jgi:AraC-like DNA-binding protein
MTDISYFIGLSDSISVSEVGHSLLESDKRVGPYVRGTYLLHFVKKGVSHFSEFDAAAGDAFLIAKGVRHGFSVEKGYEHFWLGFDGSGAEALLSLFGLPTAAHALLTVRDRALFDELVSLYLPLLIKKEGNAEAAVSFLLALLPLLSLKKKGAPAIFAGDIHTAARFMESNLSEPLTMERLASLVHLSEKHFCKKFKTAYGVPPRSYLVALRMQRASELLLATDMKVKEIAASVGYPSQLAFSDAFFHHYGVRPTEYKKLKM